MKNISKTILLLFLASLILTSCKKVLPTAEFSLSGSGLVKWDKATITSSASDAEETTYTVTGGTYEFVDETTIQFFEAASYTVKQTVSNEDGDDDFSVTVVVSEPDNEYTLDGAVLPLTANAFWFDATGMGGTIYIRMLADVSGQDNPNLIKLYPVAGPNALQNTYTYSDTGDIGTYDAGMTANYAGFDYDWTTFGNGGQDLIIELIYEDTNNTDNNVYEITLSSYTLNYGQWDFGSGLFISEGTKSFSLSYRGEIDPV